MSRDARPGARVGHVALLVAAAAWVPLVASPGLLTGHAEHAHHAPSALGMLAGWALMLVAMMTPLVAAPARHVIERSFRRRRARSVALFALGHAAVWMAAGAALLGAMQALRHAVVQPVLVAALVGVVALAWQCSPARQRCVNRSHHHPALAGFGLAADRDALRFGVTHGAWCVASCWALMLLPLALPGGHLAAMFVVTLLMLSERLEGPQPPAWRLHVPMKLPRILVAQTRIRLAARPSGAARADE